METKQAEDFLTRTNTKCLITYSHTAPSDFSGANHKHDMYNVVLERNKRTYAFVFTDSLRNTQRREYARDARSLLYTRDDREARKLGFKVTAGRLNKDELLEARKPPTAYDVLACLTKYDPGSFENFCADYGYSTDSRKGLAIWEAVHTEYAGVLQLFSDCMDDELREIN